MRARAGGRATRVTDRDGHVDLYVQGSTNRRALGLVNFVLALAYHFCLNLPAAFTQPGVCLLVEPSSYALETE